MVAYRTTRATPDQKSTDGHRLCGLAALYKAAGCPLGPDEPSLHAWAAIQYGEYAAGFAEGWDGYPCCMGMNDYPGRVGWRDGRFFWSELEGR